MKNLINKSLRIVAIIAMMISVGNANKDEAPILIGNDRKSVDILPRDYITIHSVTMGKENGDCKIKLDDDFSFSGRRQNKKLGEKLSWTNKGSIGFYNFSYYHDVFCSPDIDEENAKYIIVLTTNFGSYVYEYIYADYEKAKADSNQKNGYILPLIDYKK